MASAKVDIVRKYPSARPPILPTLGGLPDRADAQDVGAEDDRGDHHLDEVDEERPQPLQLDGEGGKEQADEDAEADGDEYGDVEVLGAVPALSGTGAESVRDTRAPSQR